MATWAEDIVTALERLGGSGTYSDIYAEVAKLRPNLPRTWKDVVRRVVEDRSSDSAGFKHHEDLFFSVQGLGRGVWGLRSAVTETPAAVDLRTNLLVGNLVPVRAKQLTYRILRDTPLAREVKLLHRDQCQLCGEVLWVSPSQTYSEAHHIIPLGGKHNGPDVASNIIVLCPNHHALCDYGAILLDRASIRPAAGHYISDESLAYHNDQIAGAVA